MKHIPRCLNRIVAFAAILLLSARVPLVANEVMHWHHVALDATARALPLNPVGESRVLAIVHAAMHDAANAIEPRYHTFAGSPVAARGGSVDAAVAAAAHDTLCTLLPQEKAVFDAALASATNLSDTAEAVTRGAAAGRAAAAAVLHLRENDGANASVSIAPGKRQGEYRPTPPDFTPAVLPHWGSVQPFVLESGAQFRPPPPPAVGSAQARAEIETVRLIGGSDSQQRSHEQSEIACFWYEDSTKGWNRIAGEVVLAQKLDLWEQARLLALVNLAMADGFIGGFEAKYHYNYWRPVTAIREAGHAGWLSYTPTPPVPDYSSTHSILGAAAATVLARTLGSDFVSFSMTSGEPFPNITRRFWSFSEAARENAASRVLAGIHFPAAVEAGYHQGSEIGAWVFDHALQPLESEKRIAQLPR